MLLVHVKGTERELCQRDCPSQPQAGQDLRVQGWVLQAQDRQSPPPCCLRSLCWHPGRGGEKPLAGTGR